MIVLGSPQNALQWDAPLASVGCIRSIPVSFCPLPLPPPASLIHVLPWEPTGAEKQGINKDSFQKHGLVMAYGLNWEVPGLHFTSTTNSVGLQQAAPSFCSMGGGSGIHRDSCSIGLLEALSTLLLVCRSYFIAVHLNVPCREGAVGQSKALRSSPLPRAD